MKGAVLLLLFLSITFADGKTIGAKEESNPTVDEACSQLIKKIKTVTNDNKPLVKKLIKNVCKQIPYLDCEAYEKKIFTFSTATNKEMNQVCKLFSKKLGAIGERALTCLTSDKYCPYLCSKCNKVVSTINYAIQMMNITAQEIEANIKSYCKVFEVETKTCDTITGLFDKVVKKLINDISPADICVELKFCNSSSSNNGKDFMRGLKMSMGKMFGKGKRILTNFKQTYGQKIEEFKKSLKDLHKLTSIKILESNNGGKKLYGGVFKRFRLKHMKKQFQRIHKLRRQFFNMFKNKYGGEQEGEEEEEEEGEQVTTKTETKNPETTMPPEVIEEDDEDDVTDDDVIQDGVEVTDEVSTNAEQNKVIEENPYLAYDDGMGGWTDWVDDFDDVTEGDTMQDLFEDEVKEMPTRGPRRMDTEESYPKDWMELKDLYDPSSFNFDKSMVPYDYGFGDDDNDDDDDDDESSEDPLKSLLPDFTSISFPKSFVENLDNMMKETKEKMNTLEKKTSSVLPMTTAINNNIPCTLCTTIVGFIKNEIDFFNATEQQIIKFVNEMCQLYPFEIAKEVCMNITEEVDEIIQLIEEDVDPKDICVKIGLCPSTGTDMEEDGFETKVTTYVKPTGDCNAMCGFWRAVYSDDVRDVMQLWIDTKENIVKMCQHNEFKTKCFGMLRTFEKAERQLGSVLTSENMQQLNTTQETNANCKCFKKQPVFVTKENDKCQLCRQMENGLREDIADTKESIDFLVQKLGVFCGGVLKQKVECLKIIEVFKSSFGQLNRRMEMTDDLCTTIGYCIENDESESESESASPWKNMMKHMMARGEDMFESVMGGMGGSSPFGCKFCKKCMENIDSTMKFTQVNSTNMEEKTPALKSGFAIFCRSQVIGDETKKVCQQIYNGMETVQKTLITKANTKKQDGGNDDMSTICKEMGMC